MPRHAVKTITITITVAALLLCIACAATTTTSEGPVIRASRFVYDPQAKPMEGGTFVFDAKAPALHASAFLVPKI